MTRLLLAILIAALISCNSGRENSTVNDTARSSSGVDSMPVVKPSAPDSASIILTPPVHDSNAVVPDTGRSQ